MTSKQEEILIAEHDFDSIFNYDAGLMRSKFLIALRDKQKILGIKCGNCKKVYVPVRSTCNKCFSQLNDLVEVSNIGTVVTFSVVNSPQPYYPQEPPFVYGIIHLDGADNGLVHLIGEVNPEGIYIGMRVEAVFSEKRIGHIKDIKYFKPIRV